MSETPLAPATQIAALDLAPQPVPPAGDQARLVIRMLSAVTFLEWFGASVGLPLLPVYVRDRGASSVTIGMVVASFFVAGLLLQYVSGRLVESRGSSPVLRTGLVVAAVGGLSLALPLTPALYGVSRFLQGAGSGAAEVAALALVGAVVPRDRHGRAFAAIYGSQLSGMAIGPMLGSLIGAFSVTAVFVVAGLITLLAWIPVAVLHHRVGVIAIPPQDRSAPRPRPARGAPAGSRARQARTPSQRALLGAVIAAAAFGLTIGVYETCWTLLLTSNGAANWQVGLSWTLFALPFVVATRPAGRLADTVDRRMLVIVALTVSLLCCAVYPFLHSLIALLLLGGVEAAATATAMPSVQSLLTHGTDPSRLGRAQGLYATSQTAATALAAGISGSLFAVKAWVPFVGGAVLGILLIATLPAIWASVAGKSQPAAG